MSDAFLVKPSWHRAVPSSQPNQHVSTFSNSLCSSFMIAQSCSTAVMFAKGLCDNVGDIGWSDGAYRTYQVFNSESWWIRSLTDRSFSLMAAGESNIITPCYSSLMYPPTNVVLVGGAITILQHISQWEGLSHRLWQIKNVWNHQPVLNRLPNWSNC